MLREGGVANSIRATGAAVSCRLCGRLRRLPRYSAETPRAHLVTTSVETTARSPYPEGIVNRLRRGEVRVSTRSEERELKL